jgi:hypothetical protein
MSMHLTKDELALIIQKTPSHLASNRFLHYEKCGYCRILYKQQISIHTALVNIKPLKAPASIITNVIRTAGAMSIKIPKKKTDWLFLVALITLFAIGSWFIFSGSIGESLGQYVSQIMPDIESTDKAPAILKSFTESMKSVDFAFDIFLFNGHTLYLFFGIISFLFYMFLDKKFGQGYKKNTLISKT